MKQSHNLSQPPLLDMLFQRTSQKPFLLFLHLINQMSNIAIGRSKIMKTMRQCSPSDLPVPSRHMDKLAFITQRQRYEFIDKPGAEMDLPFVLYHEKNDKCYYFIDISELKSAPLSTVPFDAKCMLYKSRHFCIQRLN